MYQIDDALIYGSFGVCRVADITEREFCGSESLYYVLEPVFDSGCTFFVDVHNSAAASRLRPALEPEDAELLIAAMPRVEEQWEDEPRQRKARYSRIIAGGDRLELIGLIKALHNYGQQQRSLGKKLGAGDEQCLRLAEKLIDQEIAHALRREPAQVASYIESRLALTAQ